MWKNGKWKKRLKELGVAGIIFFTVKGTITLLIIIFGVDKLMGC